MNKQIKASFMISLMLITIAPAVFNVNAISNTTISDSEEDCIECKSNDKTRLAVKILNKLEKNIEIKTDILPLDRPICNKLDNLIDKYVERGSHYYNLSENAPPDSEEQITYLLLYVQYMVIAFILVEVGIWLNCWDNPFPPPY